MYELFFVAQIQLSLKLYLLVINMQPIHIQYNLITNQHIQDLLYSTQH